MRKKTGIFLSAAAVIGILFLTFQSSEDTIYLSKTVLAWLNSHNIKISHSQLRSGIHIPLYFPLGFVLCLCLGVKKAIITGTLFGLADESIKILLPTRHFSFIDFCKDFIGAALGAICCGVMIMLIKNEKKKQLGNPDNYLT